MRLVRFGSAGHEKPGLFDNTDVLRDISNIIPDISPEHLSPEALKTLAAIDAASLPTVTEPTRLGQPITGIGNIIGIGLNYADHARETKGEPPPEPIVFFKHTGSLSGPTDDIIAPPHGSRLDWEAELAVVIGSPAHRVTEDQALNYVAGYMVANDVSERDAQFKRQGQWAKGKSAPTFCPIGPYFVTKDAVLDPQNLDIRLSVNGEPMQVSSTKEMIFTVPFLVAYLSQFMRLLPGDIIVTGTPAGVGLGRKLFLKPGDTITTSLHGLGEQSQTVVA